MVVSPIMVRCAVLFLRGCNPAPLEGAPHALLQSHLRCEEQKPAAAKPSLPQLAQDFCGVACLR